jgi:Shikimate kinase
MIRLIGPGGAGKSTIGALLAERLNVPFLDLDRHLAGRVGDISEYINRHGYDAYARENVEAYCSLLRRGIRPDVLALSSGFMTYASNIHWNTGAFAANSKKAPGRPSSCPLLTANCVWLRPSAGKSRVHSEDLRREKRP